MLTEIKALCRLALPILVSQLSMTTMSFVDTAMAGHYSRNDLAAIAIGGSLWLPALVFTQSLLYAVTPLVAQARGRGNLDDSGQVLRQGLWLGCFAGMLIGGVMLMLIPLLDLFGVENNIRVVGKEYLFWLAFGLPFAGIFQAMHSFVEAYGRTRPVMVINLLGLLSNIPLNYIFIYGKLGLPAMGGAGCGVATALVLLIMAIALALYIFVNDLRPVAFRPHWTAPELSGQLRLLALGLPIGISVLVEVSIFTVIALIIAPLGSAIVAGHQVALNLTAMMFMLPLSLSLALTIRIGYFAGQGNQPAVQTAVRAGFVMALLIALLNAVIIWQGRGVIAAIYTADAEVQLIAVSLLFFAAVYQFPDAIQVCCVGILRGCNITRRPMLVTLFAYWLVAFPVGYLLGLTNYLVPALGARGLWIGLVIGLTLAAILLVVIVIHVLRGVPATAGCDQIARYYRAH